jgi:hypothetical protein
VYPFGVDPAWHIASNGEDENEDENENEDEDKDEG